MAKLTSKESKAHAAALELLKRDTLTFDERELVYRDFQPAATHNVTVGGAFFTPWDLAQDLCVYAPDEGRIVDIAAGIGGLSLALASQIWALPRFELVCIERNPEYVAVGKKLVPEATWVCADVFDKGVWDELGRFDCAVSNPPFGNIKPEADTSWLPYRGVADLMAVAVALETCDMGGVFILPQMSCPYRYSGQRTYEQHTPGAMPSKVKSFLCAYPNALFGPTSVDTTAYQKEWRGVSPTVELVDVALQPLEAVA